MTSKYKELGECIELIIDHRGKTPKKMGGDWVDKGVKTISAKNVHGGKLDNLDSIRYVSEEVYRKWMKEDIKRGDCLLASEGATLGENLYWNSDEKVVIGQRLYCIRTNNNILDAKYFSAYINTHEYQKEIEGRATGTSVLGIKQTDLLKTMVLIKGIEEQRFIGNLYFEINQKIETNNKINKKFEEMAQSIFKQWFVDFEFPNEDEQPYKSSGGEMVESELGIIPKSWKVGCFREFTDTVLGGDWGKETEQGNYNKEVLCLRGADIPEIKYGKYGAPAKRYILEKNFNNKRLNAGDLVVEISGGSPTQSTGRITYINEGILNRYDLDFVCTNFCRAITLSNKKSMEYFYFYWSYLYDLNVFFQYENGTTGIKNFDVNTFLDKHQIIVPPNHLLERYHQIVSNLLNTIQHNGLENSKLMNTRDLLIPKLMSGEIRVPLNNAEN